VLAEEILKPGIESVVMFRTVQRRVRAAIHQEPYLGFNALGDVYFAGKPDTADMRVDYELAERINTEAAWELFIKTHKSGYPVELARERLRLLHAQAEATANAKRLEEERMAAEQRAREDAESKLRAEAAAAKKKAEEEAVAKAQAEAKATAKRREEERIAAEQRAREAEAAWAERQRLAAVAAEAEEKSTTVVAASPPEQEAPQQAKRDSERHSEPTKLAALPKLEQPHNSYDGAWTIVRIGPNCPVNPHLTITIKISGGRITGYAAGGALHGSISATGAFHFTHPAVGGKPVYYSGTIKGTHGKGSFKATQCVGTLTLSRG
jgi:hypothetical protein